MSKNMWPQQGQAHSQGFKGLVGVERERERKPLKTGDCLFFAHFTARPGPDLRLVFNARRVGDGWGSGGTQHAEIWGAREGRNKGILQELSESLKGQAGEWGRKGVPNQY